MKKLPHTIGEQKHLLSELNVLRQAFTLASVLITTGILLAYTVHTYLIALPLLVAGGLLFTSIAGWCPMLYILERMPWNR